MYKYERYQILLEKVDEVRDLAEEIERLIMEIAESDDEDEE